LKSNYWQHPKYDLHYYTEGNPDKPVVIFFHGFMGSGLDWEDVIKILSQEFYCIAVDLPGHGKTVVHGPITNYSMESFTTYFAIFVKKWGLNPAVLVGYSMGGRLALFLSVYFKNLWSAAILESATPGLRKEKQRIERRTKDNQLAKKFEKVKLDEFMKEWYQQSLFKTIKNSDSFDSLFKRRLNNHPDELVKSLKMMGVGVQPSLWNACSSINMPILLLAGEFDRKFCNIIRDMKNINSDFEIKIIENAGHNVHVEQPNVYIQLIYNFLTSIRENRS
jgi:2-succinyl-6-hydroxy-2,4-cyclohexadiene-1-carboxylate synthase